MRRRELESDRKRSRERETHRSRRLDVSAASKKELHKINMALIGCEVKRRTAVLRSCGETTQTSANGQECCTDGARCKTKLGTVSAFSFKCI